MNDDKTVSAAIESAFLVYQFGFEELGFKKSRFDVHKGNEKVISFHKKMGAQPVGENEENVHFEITQDAVRAVQDKFKGKIR